MSDYITHQNTICNFNHNSSWVILSTIEQQIKTKIERIGTPLKDWDIQINYGIKTGYNEAFIISGEKRKELIEKDPKSEEIIRPILRGRDINRFGYNFADLWLINTHNGIKEKDIDPININDYPAIKQHLDNYYTQLEKRADKGNTPYNLRNCSYLEDFYKQKILWAETMRIHKNEPKNFPRFGFENDGQFITDKTCFFATGDKLKFILAVLNSTVGRYLCSKHVSILDDGGYLMQKIYIEKIPLAPYSAELENLVNNESHKEYENEINKMVYDLYSLNKDEISFIESLDNQLLQGSIDIIQK